MAFQSAFWAQGYWYQGYQTIRPAVVAANEDTAGGGWYDYNYREESLHRELIREQQKELNRVNEELAKAAREKQRLEALKAKKKAAKGRVVLLSLQEQEISRLRQRQIWLVRQIQEQEAILAVLLMAARRRFRLVAFN